MKAVILAGGLGTRISEESALRPKPMVEIGGKPILWHILKIYAAHGLTDFIICCGYKGYQIQEYFANYFLHTCNVTFDLGRNRMDIHPIAAQVERHIAGVQEVVREIFLDLVALISAADDEVGQPMRGVDLQDVPQDRLSADLHHGLRTQRALLADARPQSPRQYHGLHRTSSFFRIA